MQFVLLAFMGVRGTEPILDSVLSGTGFLPGFPPPFIDCCAITSFAHLPSIDDPWLLPLIRRLRPKLCNSVVL